MKCTSCESGKDLKVQKKSVKYDISGLDNVTIKEAKVFECPHCGERYIQFGDHDKIDHALATSLIKKRILTGKEVRFLRTWQGLSGKEFAKYLKISPEYLYRIEGGKNLVSDKLSYVIRLVIGLYALTPSKKKDYFLHDIQEEENLGRFTRIEISFQRGHYKAKYA